MMISRKWMIPRAVNENYALMFTGNSLIVIEGYCDPVDHEKNSIKRITILSGVRQPLADLLRNNPVSYNLWCMENTLGYTKPFVPTMDNRLFILSKDFEAIWLTQKDIEVVQDLIIEGFLNISSLPPAYRVFWKQCADKIGQIKLSDEVGYIVPPKRRPRYKIFFAKTNRTLKIIEFAFRRKLHEVVHVILQLPPPKPKM